MNIALSVANESNLCYRNSWHTAYSSLSHFEIDLEDLLKIPQLLKFWGVGKLYLHES